MAFWWYGVLCFLPAGIVWNSGHLSSSRWVICNGLPIVYLVLSLIPACLGQYIHRNLWRCWDMVILFPLIQQVLDSISTGWLVETSLEWQEHFSQIQLVTSIFLHAYESWTLTAELQRRIQTMEMRCYRKILHVSYKDHITNEEVCAKIRQAIVPHEDDLTISKRR